MTRKRDGVNAPLASQQTNGLPMFAEPACHADDPWTSRAAADKAKSTAQTHRDMILARLDELGERGATADEMDAHMGWRHLTAARRLTELDQAKLAFCRGDTRPSDTGCQARIYRHIRFKQGAAA